MEQPIKLNTNNNTTYFLEAGAGWYNVKGFTSGDKENRFATQLYGNYGYGKIDTKFDLPTYFDSYTKDKYYLIDCNYHRLGL